MTIQFSCPKCKRSLSVPDISAGSTGKCKCGAQVTVPRARTARPSTAPATPPYPMPAIPHSSASIWIVGLSLLVVTLGAVAVYFIKTRDTWERDNYSRLRQLAHEGNQLEQEGQLSSAVSKYEQVVNDVATHVIRDAMLRADVESARERINTLPAKLAAQKQQQEQMAAKQASDTKTTAYKEAAQHCADEFLRLLSAIESGVTYSKYVEMVGAVQFEFNKLSRRCSAEEQSMTSFRELDQSLQSLRNAGDWWNLAITKYNGDASSMSFLRKDWATAAEHYKRAVDALADGR